MCEILLLSSESSLVFASQCVLSNHLIYVKKPCAIRMIHRVEFELHSDDCNAEG
jgi:hypothetical protein